MTLHDQILSFYYRWHRFEAGNQVDILDFDLIGRGTSFPGTFRDRNEAHEMLVGLLRDFEAQSGGNPFLAGKLKASLYYLRALMGETIGFDEYVTHTMGIAPALIPETLLAKELAKSKTLLSTLGYEFSSEGLLAFRQDTRYGSADEIRESFKAFESRIVPQVSSWLGLSLELDYGIEFVEQDAYWLNWVSTDEHGRIMLRFNLHPRKRDNWQRGVEEVMVFHEICGHVFQCMGWQKAIREGRLDETSGLTMVFTPEQFACEGIAQTLIDFFPEPPLSPHGRFMHQQSILRTLVSNNAHIMTNRGDSDERIFEFMSGYLPLIRLEDVTKSMGECRNHPLFRTYQYVYGISAHHHRMLAERLDPEGKRRFVLETFSEPLLPQRITQRQE